MANVKLNTKITSFADVQKSLQSIEKHLNDLSSSVNTSAESEVSDKDGKTGDIKTTRNADGSYTFEIRTEEGWKTPSFGENLIKFKDKNSSFSQNKLQSIEDIEAEDTTSGDTKAAKNIFDEKNDTFSVAHLTGIPRPDFESAWTTLTITETLDSVGITITHDLGSIPNLVQIYASEDGNDYHTVSYGVGHNLDNGITCKLTTTTIVIHSGDHSFARVVHGSTPQDITSGKVKVLLWK